MSCDDYKKIFCAYYDDMHSICGYVFLRGDDADDAAVMLRAWLFGESCTSRLPDSMYEDLLKEINNVVSEHFL